MNNKQPQQLGFRNPLFNETVVKRSLTTILETVDMLIDMVDSADPKMLGLKGGDIIRFTLALKVNEITDELALERVTE